MSHSPDTLVGAVQLLVQNAREQIEQATQEAILKIEIAQLRASMIVEPLRDATGAVIGEGVPRCAPSNKRLGVTPIMAQVLDRALEFYGEARAARGDCPPTKLSAQVESAIQAIVELIAKGDQ